VPDTTEVTVTVPAKINLGLAVGPRRPDGFHDLRTVFAGVELFDTVRIRPDDHTSLELTGPEAGGLVAGPSNLAWQAADRLGRNLAITVDKQIPVAAGLAGGSADAAGVLLAVAALDRRPVGELAEVAAELGSDVNFALTGGLALGSGRGEQLRPLAGPHRDWVLVFGSDGLATPAVYAELDRQRRQAAAPRLEAGLLAAVAAGPPEALGRWLHNDLEPAALALAPELLATLAAGRAAGALAGQISGSGPTCMFLARDQAHAELLARALAGTGRRAVAVRSGAGPEVRACRR